MPNPPDGDPTAETTEIPTAAGSASAEPLAEEPAAPDDAVTETLSTEAVGSTPAPPGQEPPERRFTAPGFDASQTEVIPTAAEAPTQVLRSQPDRPPGRARPQLIPPRFGRLFSAPDPGISRIWVWVLTLILVIVAAVAIAVLGTLWLTRHSGPKVSQEDRVRQTIRDFDVAVQKGDLAALRSITCGSVRDGYDNYNEQAWADTYRRVEAARQYPVVASIDEVNVADDHAEANVTAFMAYAPQIRSTRSFDLQYRDNQWKICQARTG